MIKNIYNGIFIAFEGIDGSGSSTQVDLLSKNLNNSGLFAFSTKEPTNNLIGGLIRGALTHDWKASAECLQLLFAADRAHHLQREIFPSLEKGNIIVTDRYLFSTIAYGSLDLDKKWLIELNNQFILPDLTFFIHVPAKICIKRIGKSRNEFELFEEEKKLSKVLNNYKELSKDPNNKIVKINGNKSIRQIEEEVMVYVKKIIKKKDGKIRHREGNLFGL